MSNVKSVKLPQQSHDGIASLAKRWDKSPAQVIAILVRNQHDKGVYIEEAGGC